MEIAFRTHYQLFFALGAFLSLYPLYKAYLKYSISPAHSLIIYYLFPLFYLECQSIVRNGIAFSFVFYAFTLLLEGRKKNTILSLFFIVLAFFFHKSALIGLLIYPVFYFRHFRIAHFAVYIASLGLSYLVIKTIGSYSGELQLLLSVQGYVETAHEGGGMMTLIVNGLGITNLLLWEPLSKQGKNISLYMGMFNIGVCIWNIFQCVDIILATRLSVYFLLALTLIVPYYRECFLRRIKVNISLMFHLFFILLFTSSLVISIHSFLQEGGRMSNVPYQTVFGHKDYYNLQ